MLEFVFLLVGLMNGSQHVLVALALLPTDNALLPLYFEEVIARHTFPPLVVWRGVQLLLAGEEVKNLQVTGLDGISPF